MVFEKGNQLAVGNKGGLEKTHDREDYAQKLLEWVEKPSSIHMISFCAQHKLPGSVISRWSKENDVFRQAVEIARPILADRQEYLVQIGRMDLKQTARMAGYYNDILNEYERGEKTFDNSLKKDLETTKEMPSKIEVVDYKKAEDE